MTTVNLEAHFRQHGLSARAYEKMKNDVNNGDMTVDILVKFEEYELNTIANEYSLSTLQKKAFVEAVKLLPNLKANINSNNKNKQFVFVTPEEQSILKEMIRLKKEFINTSFFKTMWQC